MREKRTKNWKEFLPDDCNSTCVRPNGNRELWHKFGKEMEAWEERNPSPGPAYLEGFERNGRLRYAHPEGYAWMQRRNEYRLNKTLERTKASTKLIWPKVRSSTIRPGCATTRVRCEVGWIWNG